MDTMRRHGIPITRENYIAMNEPNNMIHDSEAEAAMPPHLQKMGSMGYAKGGKVRVATDMLEIRHELAQHKKAK
jgi:hypothetical protein